MSSRMVLALGVVLGSAASVRGQVPDAEVLVQYKPELGRDIPVQCVFTADSKSVLMSFPEGGTTSVAKLDLATGVSKIVMLDSLRRPEKSDFRFPRPHVIPHVTLVPHADGTRFLAFLGNGVNQLDETNSKAVRGVLKHDGDLFSVCWSPDGKQVLTVARQKLELAPDIKAKVDKLQGEINRHHSEIFELQGKIVALANLQKTPAIYDHAARTGPTEIRLWDLETGKELGKRLSAPDAPLPPLVAWLPDSKTFFLGHGQSQSSEVAVRGAESKGFAGAGRSDLEGYETLWVGHKGNSLCAIRKKDHVGTRAYMIGPGAATPGGAGTGRANPQSMLRCIAHRSLFTQPNQPVIETPFVFSIDEPFVLAIEEDARIARFYADVTKNRKPDQARSLKHDLPIYRMAMTKDGKRAATATGIFGRPSRVLVWNLQTAQPIANIPHDGKIELMEFSPDGQVLTTVNDQNVKFWKLPAAK